MKDCDYLTAGQVLARAGRGTDARTAEFESAERERLRAKAGAFMPSLRKGMALVYLRPLDEVAVYRQADAYARRNRARPVATARPCEHRTARPRGRRDRRAAASSRTASQDPGSDSDGPSSTAAVRKRVVA